MPTKSLIRKINRNFQITLPPEFREQYDLKEGDPLEVVLEKENLIVRPVEIQRKKIVKEINKIFKKCDEKIKGTEFERLPEDKVMKIVDNEIRQYRKRGKFSASKSKAIKS